MGRERRGGVGAARDRGGLTAAEASARPAGAAHSVAEHVRHVRFLLAAAHAWLTDPPPPPELRDWESSWGPPEVDEAAWRELVADLRATYAKLRAALASADPTGDELTGAIATPAHVACDLGAVGQLAAVVRNS